MLANHPLTGAPIRILKTSPTITSDAKTLVWLRASFVAGTRWGRWNVAISEPAAVEVCGAEAVGLVLLEADAKPEDWRSAFTAIFGPAESSALLIGPSAVLTAFEAAGLVSARSFITEDLYDSYPYLGEPLKAGDSLPKVLISMAHVLRINRIAWSEPCDRDAHPADVRAQLDAWGRACCTGAPALLTLANDASDAVVPRCWLIQQYYVDSSSRRAREIRTCLEKNLACEYVDKILLLNEKEHDLPTNPKLQTEVLGHRLRYYDVFVAIKAHVPAGDFVIFANSDIWFNDTLNYLWKIPLTERRLFLALLRWEDEETPRLFGPRADSQDAWIVARDTVDFPLLEDDLGFPFGKPGCDNAIALIMMRNRFLIVNPAYSIQTLHLHSSQVRRYNPSDVLYRPAFLYVDPSAIQGSGIISDMRGKEYTPSATIGAAWGAARLGDSFPRAILCGKAAEDGPAFCAALRSRRTTPPWAFSANDANLWTPPPAGTPLYRLSGGHFVNSEGLVSDFRSMYTGGHTGWTRGWEAAIQSTLMSSIHVPHLVAAPFKPDWHSLSQWVLHYLPRALAIREAVAAGGEVPPEFLVPQDDAIGAFLADCKWKHGDNRGNITVVPYMADMTYYADTVWALPPSDDHELVTREDVAALRGLLSAEPKWEGKPIVVFCVSDNEEAVTTRAWAESVAENLFHTGWTVRYLSASDMPSARRRAFSDASWILGGGDQGLDWIWMAGEGATVMEFVSEQDSRGDTVHLTGACGQRYVLGLVKRESLMLQRQNALLAVAAAVEKYGFRELVSSPAARKEKPVVVLPSGAALTGIWHHAGDTFREMASLWEERGFVRLEHSEGTPYCWWGGIGQTLLYDRPTPRWWTTPPPYQMALFGNCPPPGPGPHALKQSAWSFWGRRPRLLEGVAQRVENTRGYESRSTRSIFLGKIENGVQHAARTGADWSTAVELFSMPIDSTGKAYPYSAEQYLEKLCNARFGLCLPGYGPKCNREIEYFCCGVVPIVTPGVDMKGYLVSPKEGVHYFVASTPEEVRRIVETTPAERWAAMSAAGREWWRLYASAEGLFRLTWARIEQCKPYLNIGIPARFIV
jgi:hypothetical protein